MNEKNLSHEKIDYKEVGLRIKLMRGETSQTDYARELGLNQTDISRLERGEVTNPSPEILFKICIKSHPPLNLYWLLTGKGWSHTPKSPEEGREWFLDQIKRKESKKEPEKEFAVALVFYLGQIWLLGCVLLAGKETISASSIEMSSYREILGLAKGKGIQVYKAVFRDDTLDWSTVDFSNFRLMSNSLNIDAEINSLDGRPFPKDFELKRVVFEYDDPKLGDLLNKVRRIFKDGSLKERAEVRGIIEEIYDEVQREANQADIKKSTG